MAKRVRRHSDRGVSTGTMVLKRNEDPNDPLHLVKRADESRQSHIDGNATATGADSDNREISPIYPFGMIDAVYKKSNTLPQCVDAMVTNIGGWGYQVVPIKPDQEMNPKEEETLKSWIELTSPGESMMLLQRRQIFTYEKNGFMMYEVIRNREGVPTLLKHVEVVGMRAMGRQNETVKVVSTIKRSNGERMEVIERKRFRKYKQQIGGKTVWFKQWGDPRTMDLRTGAYQGRGTGRIPEQYKATEIMHFKQESEDVYGVPRWINQLPSILGSREAEQVNVRYFQDNTIPPSIITISGGRLTRESFLEIRRVINEGGVGKQNQIMLLEAIPESEGIDDKGVAKISIEKMADSRQSDALFKEYDDANMAKIRSSFRLPPVLLGMSQDVTFATANVSAFLAETQVFNPERTKHDENLNKNFVNSDAGLGMKTVKLQSKGPQLTAPESVVKALSAMNQMGAVTPRSAIEVVNEHLQINMPQYAEKGTPEYEEWTDQPIQLTIREIGKEDIPGETDEETDPDSKRAKGAEEGDTSGGAPINTGA